ncbi:DNA repair protein RecO [Corynebacterium frankenforstense]|uniref:DNA repair protein RecO n=1 Tax=Corynebacterium frankenforstense TaxID=1230998 RepID=UPI00254A335D|nr:DNA repair protein RecO [Corynebacterium frankenforstense]MDK6259277.1 DNA repair protein RecO [Corynebacterium frankenforstense]
MRRESFRDRALVLRTYDFAEADRVIVLLTRGHGIVRSVAKGVRRAKSRFGSRLQLFVDLDVQLYPGRNLATIMGADTVAFFGSGIIDDYERYAAACAALECAERLAVAEDGSDSFLYDAALVTLGRIQRAARPVLALDAFILQVTAHAGWALSLFDCAQCSAPGPHHAFHPGAGGAVCLHCRPSGSADVPTEALHLMWLLAHDRVEQAVAVVAGEGGAELAAVAHRLTRAHLQWQVEGRVAALAVLDEG